jgi:hypothetical protein
MAVLIAPHEDDFHEVTSTRTAHLCGMCFAADPRCPCRRMKSSTGSRLSAGIEGSTIVVFPTPC